MAYVNASGRHPTRAFMSTASTPWHGDVVAHGLAILLHLVVQLSLLMLLNTIMALGLISWHRALAISNGTLVGTIANAQAERAACFAALLCILTAMTHPRGCSGQSLGIKQRHALAAHADQPSI